MRRPSGSLFNLSRSPYLELLGSNKDFSARTNELAFWEEIPAERRTLWIVSPRRSRVEVRRDESFVASWAVSWDCLTPEGNENGPSEGDSKDTRRTDNPMAKNIAMKTVVFFFNPNSSHPMRY